MGSWRASFSKIFSPVRTSSAPTRMSHEVAAVLLTGALGVQTAYFLLDCLLAAMPCTGRGRSRIVSSCAHLLTSRRTGPCLARATQRSAPRQLSAKWRSFHRPGYSFSAWHGVKDIIAARAKVHLERQSILQPSSKFSV